MTPVEHLRRIAATIPTTRQARIGSTGYLDGPAHLTVPAAKGVDEFGRVFITLSVRAEGRTALRTFDNTGIVTVFQRWTQLDTIVTQANNTRCAPRLIDSHANPEEMALIEELVTHGTASRTITEVVGGTLHERLTLVHPEPLVEEAHKAIRSRLHGP